MRALLLTPLLLLRAFLSFSQQDCGIYHTKDDYLNKRLTIIHNLLPTENYNVGSLEYKFRDKKTEEERIEKINCLKENHWGFRYLDGHDYMLMNGFYAKIVVVGRIDLLISPKATYSLNADSTYVFSPSPEGKINYYFMKDLDPSTVQPFEKLVTDEKNFLKTYQADRENYGDFIYKQMAYLKKYNAIVPKPTVKKRK